MPKHKGVAERRPPTKLGLERRDVRGARALRALLGLIRDLGALCEGLEALAGDGAVVDEEVLGPLVGRDEAEALVVAEPLDGSGSHVVFLHGVVRAANAGEAVKRQLRALALRRQIHLDPALMFPTIARRYSYL